MNFRRQPFQFSTIDPAKRQAELQKRFGLPNNNNEMFVDFVNPGILGSGMKEPSPRGSPRLQHRVPLFTESAEETNSKLKNVDTGHKPKVRIVPIQVEGVDGGAYHRTLSGQNGGVNMSKEKLPPSNSFINQKIKNLSQPEVCTIPGKVEESREDKHKVDSCSKASEPVKKIKSEMNGCSVSTDKNKVPGVKTDLFKKIEVVLNKLDMYKGEVEKFSGTPKDKQYRYLDEMLTRCMLDLDNVDTMGLDEVRKARKEAVRQVQHYVDLLDTKVTESVSKIDSDTSINSIVGSRVEQITCDIPTNETTSSNVKDDSSDIPNECEEVKMSGDMLIHKQIISNNPSRDNESVRSNVDIVNSNDCLKECEVKISGDVDNIYVNECNGVCEVEMTKNVSCPSIPEGTVNEVSMDNTETESKVNIGLCKSETKLQSTSCTLLDSEMKDCDGSSEFVLEEGPDRLKNMSNGCTSESRDNRTDLCVASDMANCEVNEKIPMEHSCNCAPVILEDKTDYEKL